MSENAYDLLPEGVDLELIADFVTESQDHMDALDENLSTLEAEPTNADAINRCFRAVHTIKGVSGFVGADAILGLTHAAEDLLGRARDKSVVLAESHLRLLYDALDLLRKMVNSLGEAHDDGRIHCFVGNWQEHKSRLRTLIEQIDSGASPTVEIQAAEEVSLPESLPDEGDPVVNAPAIGSESSGAGKGSIVKESMRIETEKVDSVVDAIGELIISESIVLHNPGLQEYMRGNQDLQRQLDQLFQISRTLQDMTVTLRMVPLQATFQKMSRLAKDAGRKLGKKIDLHIMGADTEIDRRVAEQIVDPLVHLMRNAVDHGVESPEIRAQLGKPAQGQVKLKASHQGEDVVIEVCDDGKGIDPDKLADSAIKKGIIQSKEGMSSQDILALVFAPGFSMAEKLSSISGRGVGMDVVKSNVEAMGGRVLIDSVVGVGTTFRVHIPLTVGIIDGLLVRVGEETYILPLLQVEENIIWDEKNVVQMPQGDTGIRLRDVVYRVIDLAKIFGIHGAGQGSNRLGVVLEREGNKVVLLVDKIIGQQQVVIRNLSKYFHRLRYISGATIMADGSVGLIINPAAMIH